MNQRTHTTLHIVKLTNYCSQNKEGNIMNKSYYVYVSDGKIDMLYDQNTSIVSTEEDHTWSTGFDWLKRETTSRLSERINRYDKISYLEKELKKYTGPAFSPKEYISDAIPLYWQIDRVTTWINRILIPQSNTLYVIVLFGSPDNIIGSAPGMSHVSLSVMPEYIRSVCALLKEDTSDSLIDYYKKPDGFENKYAIRELMDMMSERSIRCSAMDNMHSDQKYNFLAKVLYKETLIADYKNLYMRCWPRHFVIPEKNVSTFTYILATPLYVSVDNAVDEIEVFNGVRYIKLDFQMLQKKYKKINDLIRFVKEQLSNAGLHRKAWEFVDKAEDIVYERQYSSEEITTAVWALIKEYAIDISVN